LMPTATDGRGKNEFKMPTAAMVPAMPLQSQSSDPRNLQVPALNPMFQLRHFAQQTAQSDISPTAAPQPLQYQNFDYAFPRQPTVVPRSFRQPPASRILGEQEHKAQQYQKQLPAHHETTSLMPSHAPQQPFTGHHYPVGPLQTSAYPVMVTSRQLPSARGAMPRPYHREVHQPVYTPWSSAEGYFRTQYPAEGVPIAYAPPLRAGLGVRQRLAPASSQGSKPKRIKTAKHVCPQCQKRFDHTGNYQIHLRSHSGERPFTCELCKRSFISKSNLYRHQREQHSNQDHGSRRRTSRLKKGSSGSK